MPETQYQGKPLPDIIKALTDDDWQVRNQAAEALGRIGPEAKAAVPALIELLQEPDKYLRSSAAIALGKVGQQAKPAVPALIKALKDSDEDVRQNAATALGRIGPVGPEAQAAVSDLVELLKGCTQVRTEAGGHRFEGNRPSSRGSSPECLVPFSPLAWEIVIFKGKVKLFRRGRRRATLRRNDPRQP